MTNFLKFSFNRPRVPSVGEDATGEVALGEILAALNDELVLLKLEAAVDAIVDKEVVIELGNVTVEFVLEVMASNTSCGNIFELSTK